MNVAQSNAQSALNLLDEKVLKAQGENVARFKARRRRVIFPVLAAVLTFFVGKEVVPEQYIHWIVILIIGLIFLTVIFGLMYRCPNCAEQPQGVASSVGMDGVVSHGQGIHLFPRRCPHCGYYLSKLALDADLNRLKERVDV
jgi:hypothetical protein